MQTKPAFAPLIAAAVLAAGLWGSALLVTPATAQSNSKPKLSGTRPVVVQDDKNPVRLKLKRVMIPSFVVEEVAAGKCFAMLTQESRKWDPEKTGVNIFLSKVPPERLKRCITADLRHIALGDAIQYLCQACDLDFTVDEFAISVFPKSR